MSFLLSLFFMKAMRIRWRGCLVVQCLVVQWHLMQRGDLSGISTVEGETLRDLGQGKLSAFRFLMYAAMECWQDTVYVVISMVDKLDDRCTDTRDRWSTENHLFGVMRIGRRANSSLLCSFLARSKFATMPTMVSARVRLGNLVGIRGFSLLVYGLWRSLPF